MASFFVQILIRLIVRDYQKSVIAQMRKLYARRWANSEKGSREFGMLRLARLEVERVAPDFEKSSLGGKTFLVGGAALSGLASVFQGFAASAVDERRAAGDRRRACSRRSRSSGSGASSTPPPSRAAAPASRSTGRSRRSGRRSARRVIRRRISSRQFAIYAMILLVLAWVVVPVAIAFAYAAR